MYEQVGGRLDRRSAIGGMMGCLMGPFIPAIKLPDKQPEPRRQTFYVVHYDHDLDHNASLTCGCTVKFYKEDSAAAFILRRLFEEQPYKNEPYTEIHYRLLRFLWDLHDHEAVHITEFLGDHGILA